MKKFAKFTKIIQRNCLEEFGFCYLGQIKKHSLMLIMYYVLISFKREFLGTQNNIEINENF